jgi:hypothetical protein
MSKRLPVGRERAAIAEAVHQTVCEETATDGRGQCMLYAAVGAFLSGAVFNTRYYPQAGTLQLQHDPEDPNHWIIFDARGNGAAAGEFHAWFALPSSRESIPSEMVDLSSRHYPGLVSLPTISDRQTTIAGDLAATLIIPSNVRYEWKRKEPCPPYIWIDGNRQPDWVNMVPDESATRFFYEKIGQNTDYYRRLVHQAWKKYQDLIAR